MALMKQEMLREQKTKGPFFLGSINAECLNNRLSALKLKRRWSQARRDMPVTPALGTRRQDSSKLAESQTQNPHLKSQLWRLVPVTPVLGRWTQADLWSSLASERPCLKKQSRQHLRKDS